MSAEDVTKTLKSTGILRFKFGKPLRKDGDKRHKQSYRLSPRKYGCQVGQCRYRVSHCGVPGLLALIILDRFDIFKWLLIVSLQLTSIKIVLDLNKS